MLRDGVPTSRANQPLGPDPDLAVPPDGTWTTDFGSSDPLDSAETATERFGAPASRDPNQPANGEKLSRSSAASSSSAAARLVGGWLADRAQRRQFGIALHRVSVREAAFQLGFVANLDDAASLAGSDPATPAYEFNRIADHGLTLIRMPVSELAEVLGSLTIEPVTDSGWLGVLSTWRPIVEGSRIRDPVRLRIADEIRRINYGRFRLLSRAFPVQTLDEGILMRVELLPHLHQPRIDPMLPDWEAARYAGEIIPEAAVAMHLRPDEAMIVTGPLRSTGETGSTAEDGSSTPPDHDESASGRDTDPSEQAGSGEAEAVSSRPGPYPPTMGPLSDRILSIGEELLGAPERGERAILVILPHGPQTTN
ncbi:MAG: hypothetical protein ACOC0P_01365 [Planctomycetota bacterium]